MSVILFVRFLLVVFVLSFVVIGVALLGFGIHFLFNLDHIFTSYLNDHLQASSSPTLDLPLSENDPDLAFPFPPLVYHLLYAMIILGSVTLLLGLFGCCAACQNVEMVSLFGLLLTIVLLLQLVVGFFLFYTRDSFRTGTKEALRLTIATNYTGLEPSQNTGLVTNLWDALMLQMECCGVDSFRDFALSPQWIENGQSTIPMACCAMKDKSDPSAGPRVAACRMFPTMVDSNKEVGCFVYIWRHIEPVIEKFFLLLLVLGSLKLIAGLLCCCICSTMATRRRRSCGGGGSRHCISGVVTVQQQQPRSCQCNCRYPAVNLCTAGAMSRRAGSRGAVGGCTHVYCHHDFCT